MNSAWQRLTRTVAPATSAISLATAKDHLRVEFDDDDDLFTALVDAATAMIEGPTGIGVALINQTWRLTLDGSLPLPLELPLGPVQAVTGITYVDPDHATQTLSADLYDVFTDRRPAVIDLAADATLPAIRRQLGTVGVTFIAGFGATEADVPADLRAALLMLVSHLYEHRTAVDRAGMAELPMGVSAILERHRVGRFG